MNLHSIGEFHCDVCFELFGENRKCPRILTCGHSFCQSCLENLLVQSPSCPNCKQEIQFPNIDCVPVNYSIKNVVFRFNVTAPVNLNEQNIVLKPGLNRGLKAESVDSLNYKKESSSKELPYEGYCEDHHIYKNFRCMDCKCWICGNCVALNHKSCQTLLVAVALEEMKQEISKEVETEIEAKKSQNNALDKSLKDLEGKRMSLKKEIENLQSVIKRKKKTLKSFGKTIEQLQLLKAERKKYCEKVKVMETSVISSANDDQFTKATSKLNDFLDQSRKLMEDLTTPRHLTIEILMDLYREGAVYASSCNGGVNQYGQVVIKGDRVWVHCFKPQRPQRKDVVISFRDLLITFNGSLEFPRRGFIQVDEGTSRLSDVVIAMDALTPRAMNFLLLCSGIKGRSYEGIRIECFGNCIATYSYEGAVVKGIKDGGVYEAPRKKGFVCGWEAENTDFLSSLGIWMEDNLLLKLNTKFGFIEEGLDFCERIYENNSKAFSIKHCGLVI